MLLCGSVNDKHSQHGAFGRQRVLPGTFSTTVTIQGVNIHVTEFKHAVTDDVCSRRSGFQLTCFSACLCSLNARQEVEYFVVFRHHPDCETAHLNFRTFVTPLLSAYLCFLSQFCPCLLCTCASDRDRDSLSLHFAQETNHSIFITHAWYSWRMSTVEEVTTAVRQVAAREARFAVLTERIDEMRDHLDQAGLRRQAAEAQIQGGRVREGPSTARIACNSQIGSSGCRTS